MRGAGPIAKVASVMVLQPDRSLELIDFHSKMFEFAIFDFQFSLGGGFFV